MSVQTKRTKLKKFLAFAPLILLYASTLNEFDFNYLNYKYFSFNFPFILIYYWSLKRSESLGYGSIFIASLFNDVVLGFPIGLSGLTYFIICGFAAYLRNITLRPDMVKDWLFFLLTIFIFVTVTLKIFSILLFKLSLFAFDGTLNTILFCSDKFVDFSVTIGDMILSYKCNLFIMNTSFLVPSQRFL